MTIDAFEEALELYHQTFDESYLRRVLEIDEERLLELVSDACCPPLSP